MGSVGRPRVTRHFSGGMALLESGGTMIVAVINNKGGTGKTTTSVNLAGAFAELGYSVLLVDLDPQASASIFLGATLRTLEPSVASVLFRGLAVESAIRKTATAGVDLLTADKELIHADMMLSDTEGREGLLDAALEAVRQDYDFIVCDCPPSFSVMSVNALVAAEAYIIPVTPDYLVMEDLSCIMGMVEDLRRRVELKTELMGILVTMAPTTSTLFSSGARTAKSNIDDLRRCFGRDVLVTQIGVDRRLAEAPAYGSTVFGTARSCRGAKQHMQLAEELIQRHPIVRRKALARRGLQLGRLRQRGSRDEGTLGFET